MTVRWQLGSDLASGWAANLGSGTGEITLYRSFLLPPPDGTFYAWLLPSKSRIAFTFQQCDGREMRREFTPSGNFDYWDAQSIVLTVPDVISIKAECIGGPPGMVCYFAWSFKPHYCRRCEG